MMTAEDHTHPVVPADAAKRAEPKTAYWIVFDPTGQPAEVSLKPSYDESMRACFGARWHNRHSTDWWQHNLDLGWTCREVSIVPRAEAAEQATTIRQQDEAGTMATRVEGASGFWNGATLNQKGEVK